MIRINQLKLNIKHSEADLKEKILKTLCISEDSLLSYEIEWKMLMDNSVGTNNVFV